MNRHTLQTQLINALSLLLKINVKASMIFLVIASVLTLSGSQLLFTDDSAIYGPLAGNLRLLLVYLTMTVLAVYGLSNYGRQTGLLMALGIFLLLMAGGIEFYSQINDVPVDERYRLLFIYCGLSQLAFAVIELFSHRPSPRLEKR